MTGDNWSVSKMAKIGQSVWATTIEGEVIYAKISYFVGPFVVLDQSKYALLGDVCQTKSEALKKGMKAQCEIQHKAKQKYEDYTNQLVEEIKTNSESPNKTKELDRNHVVFPAGTVIDSLEHNEDDLRVRRSYSLVQDYDPSGSDLPIVYNVVLKEVER